MTATSTRPEPLNRMPFVLILVLLAGVGMMGLLILNTTLQAQTYELRRLAQEQALLSNRAGALESQVYRLNNPADLAAKARKLGMVPNPKPGFISLPSGKIIKPGK